MQTFWSEVGYVQLVYGEPKGQAVSNNNSISIISKLLFMHLLNNYLQPMSR